MKLNQNRNKNSGHLMVLLDNYFKSGLSLIVRVNVVLNRTVVVDSDWLFDNLCGSHLQSQSELYHISWWCSIILLVIDLIGQLRRDIIGRLSVIKFNNKFNINFDVKNFPCRGITSAEAVQLLIANKVCSYRDFCSWAVVVWSKIKHKQRW